jgi:hypothetical protein
MVQTSDRVSSIAARYASMTARRLGEKLKDPTEAANTAADIRTLAASCLRQDQHKGLRGLLKRIGL